MSEEQVLGVPTALLNECGHFEGYAPMDDKYLPIFQAENQSFQLRSQAETDPGFKQLIPYIILVKGGQILNYMRGEGSGETRLLGKRSIGIGGHINPCDLSTAVLGKIKNRPEYLDDKYVNGMLRELLEELRFAQVPPAWEMPIVALLNDDSTEVGNVHLGVAHVLHLDSGCPLESREDNIAELQWTTGEALEKQRRMCLGVWESWSNFCLPHYKEWAKPKTPKVFKSK